MSDKWIKIDLRFLTHRDFVAIAIFLVALFIATIFLIYGLYSIEIWILTTSIFSGLLIYAGISNLYDRKYKFVREVKVDNDKVIYKTYGKMMFTSFYRDFGLIIDVYAFGDNGNVEYIPTPITDIVYYNRTYNRCFHVIVNRETGRKIIEKYKKYCEKYPAKKCCPILEDILKTGDIRLKSIRTLLNSSFCRRTNRGEVKNV